MYDHGTCLLLGFDFSLHAALLRGNQLPTQIGSYIKDSFCVDVVLPAVQKIVDTLKQQRRANILQDVFLFLLSVVTLLVMTITGQRAR